MKPKMPYTLSKHERTLVNFAGSTEYRHVPFFEGKITKIINIIRNTVSLNYGKEYYPILKFSIAEDIPEFEWIDRLEIHVSAISIDGAKDTDNTKESYFFTDHTKFDSKTGKYKLVKIHISAYCLNGVPLLQDTAIILMSMLCDLYGRREWDRLSTETIGVLMKVLQKKMKGNIDFNNTKKEEVNRHFVALMIKYFFCEEKLSIPAKLIFNELYSMKSKSFREDFQKTTIGSFYCHSKKIVLPYQEKMTLQDWKDINRFFKLGYEEHELPKIREIYLKTLNHHLKLFFHEICAHAASYYEQKRLDEKSKLTTVKDCTQASGAYTKKEKKKKRYAAKPVRMDVKMQITIYPESVPITFYRTKKNDNGKS
jgi:hypothetical protein